MKYQKLSVFLSGKLVTAEPGSADAIITEYLLKHIHVKEDISVEMVAEECHVGTGTVSRYVRNAGFQNFAELRELMSEEDIQFERIDGPADQLITYHTAAVNECISSVNMDEIVKLADMIRKSEKVSIFGLLKGQSAAVSLRTDLLSLGKLTYSVISPGEQMEHILHSGKDELIILFSATCSYFDYFDIRGRLEFLSCRNIWMIGCGECPSFVHHLISYHSSNIPLSHPLQLLCISEMIAQEYAKKLKK